MSSPTFGATIVYTTDGSAPSCVKQHGTIYTQPIAVAAKTRCCARWPARCCAPRASSPPAPTSSSRRSRSPTPTFTPGRRHLHRHAVGQHHDAPRPMRTIRFTSDGIARHLHQRHGVYRRHRSRAVRHAECDRLHGGHDRQRRGHGRVRDHAAGRARRCSTRRPALHQRATGHADLRDSRRHVPLHHRRLGAELHHAADLRRRHRDRQFAHAEGRRLRRRLLRQPRHQRRLRHHALPPAESVWHSIDFNNLAATADLRRGLRQHER